MNPTMEYGRALIGASSARILAIGPVPTTSTRRVMRASDFGPSHSDRQARRPTVMVAPISRKAHRPSRRLGRANPTAATKRPARPWQATRRASSSRWPRGSRVLYRSPRYNRKTTVPATMAKRNPSGPVPPQVPVAMVTRNEAPIKVRSPARRMAVSPGM